MNKKRFLKAFLRLTGGRSRPLKEGARYTRAQAGTPAVRCAAEVPAFFT